MRPADEDMPEILDQAGAIGGGGIPEDLAAGLRVEGPVPRTRAGRELLRLLRDHPAVAAEFGDPAVARMTPEAAEAILGLVRARIGLAGSLGDRGRSAAVDAPSGGGPAATGMPADPVVMAVLISYISAMLLPGSAPPEASRLLALIRALQQLGAREAMAGRAPAGG